MLMEEVAYPRLVEVVEGVAVAVPQPRLRDRLLPEV